MNLNSPSTIAIRFMVLVFCNLTYLESNMCKTLFYDWSLAFKEGITFHTNYWRWLNMKRIHFVHSSVFYHRIIIYNKPLYLCSKFLNSDVLALNTHFWGCSSSPYRKTQFFKCSYSYQIISIINFLGNLSSNSVAVFKTTVINLKNSEQSRNLAMGLCK